MGCEGDIRVLSPLVRDTQGRWSWYDRKVTMVGTEGVWDWILAIGIGNRPDLRCGGIHAPHGVNWVGYAD